MTILLLLAFFVPVLAQTEPASQPTVGCEDAQPDVFVYIGVNQRTPIGAQKYTLRKPRGRSVMGFPIPGRSSGRARYQVQVSPRPAPITVAESRPVFHVKSHTPAERLFLVRLMPCGREGCFSLYEDGPAVIALVKCDVRQLGPECYELCPQSSLNPGDYALVILSSELKPQVVARFASGPGMPDMR